MTPSAWRLPLVLGGNVFGWTADQATSFEVLDGFVEAGGVMVDTADTYSTWVPGHGGGESERVIGEWLAARGRPEGFLIASKVAKHPSYRGLAPSNVRAAFEGSRDRLGVESIDLYYAHEDDPSVPMDEIVSAFGELVAEGSVGEIGLSNFSAARVTEWVQTAHRLGVAVPTVHQGPYNLVDRNDHESLAPTLATHGITALPYYGLAKGFLTGKYRDGGPAIEGPRADSARRYLDDRGRRVLTVLDEVSAAHSTSVAAVALAWILYRPQIGAPIASARSLEQWHDLVAVADLAPGGRSALTADEVERLTSAGN
jgi:aryl-alcohol dehydrogenase-like predicted oxidoreductase